MVFIYVQCTNEEISSNLGFSPTIFLMYIFILVLKQMRYFSVTHLRSTQANFRRIPPFLSRLHLIRSIQRALLLAKVLSSIILLNCVKYRSVDLSWNLWLSDICYVPEWDVSYTPSYLLRGNMQCILKHSYSISSLIDKSQPTCFYPLYYSIPYIFCRMLAILL